MVIGIYKNEYAPSFHFFTATRIFCADIPLAHWLITFCPSRLISVPTYNFFYQQINTHQHLEISYNSTSQVLSGTTTASNSPALPQHPTLTLARALTTATMSVSSRSSFDSLRSASPAPSIQSEPERFPPFLDGPMVWKGKELSPEKYVIELTSAEVENVRAAVVGFKRRIYSEVEFSFTDKL